jgi:uncharacterized protein (TIGR02246 family)
MKKLLSLACLMVFLTAVGAPARAADSGAKAAFERASHDFESAWNAHDAKKMAAVWAEDGDLINPFNRVEKGRAEIEKLFVEEQGGPMKASTYKIESSTLREIGKDAAVGDWSAVVTGITSPDGKTQPPFPHHVTTFLVKIAGKWQVEAGRGYVFAGPPPAPAEK